ncbi:hypothetical protein BH09SUM1_BH09SUM1_26860 [soil metagenome]
MIAPLAALLRLHEIQTEAPEGSESTYRTVERNRLTQGLSTEAHRRYLKIYSRLGASAVAPMERGVCSACHVRQPARGIQIDNEIYECQNCSRLLYDPNAAFEYSVG